MGQFPFLVGDHLPYMKREGGKGTIDSSIRVILHCT